MVDGVGLQHFLEECFEASPLFAKSSRMENGRNGLNGFQRILAFAFGNAFFIFC
jgi:hypothetical protein